MQATYKGSSIDLYYFLLPQEIIIAIHLFYLKGMASEKLQTEEK